MIKIEEKIKDRHEPLIRLAIGELTLDELRDM